MVSLRVYYSAVAVSTSTCYAPLSCKPRRRITSKGLPQAGRPCLAEVTTPAPLAKQSSVAFSPLLTEVGLPVDASGPVSSTIVISVVGVTSHSIL